MRGGGWWLAPLLRTGRPDRRSLPSRHPRIPTNSLASLERAFLGGFPVLNPEAEMVSSFSGQLRPVAESTGPVGKDPELIQ